MIDIRDITKMNTVCSCGVALHKHRGNVPHSRHQPWCWDMLALRTGLTKMVALLRMGLMSVRPGQDRTPYGQFVCLRSECSCCKKVATCQIQWCQKFTKASDLSSYYWVTRQRNSWITSSFFLSTSHSSPSLNQFHLFILHSSFLQLLSCMLCSWHCGPTITLLYV